jgi:hypothetical protein
MLPSTATGAVQIRATYGSSKDPDADFLSVGMPKCIDQSFSAGSVDFIPEDALKLLRLAFNDTRK